MDVILASASPRRKEILKYLYPEFRVIPSNIREVVPHNLEVENCPEYLAYEKTKFVAAGYRNSLVIGCDTAVITDGTILNKPKDTSDARKMMEMLSGKTHRVITGCCLFYHDSCKKFSVSTDVEFYELTEQEIEQYIKSPEPYDKAGGYGIQSKGALFVKSIKGDYYNVVGLPVAELKRQINDFLSSGAGGGGAPAGNYAPRPPYGGIA